MKYTNEQLHGKCELHSKVALTLLLSLPGNHVIRGLLESIMDNLKGEERVQLEHWTEDRWYIEVIDKSISYTGTASSNVTVRCWFSVDLVKDVIVWNWKEKFPGNCGHRTIRWDRFMKRNFPDKVENHDYHRYENRY